MKQWAMPCNATRDGRVILKNSDNMWFTGDRNGKPLQYFCYENPMNSMKRQKDMTLEDGPPRLEGLQYATGEEQKAITNSSRKNEVAGPKWKQCSVVHVSGGESKIWHCKEQYCTGIWNVKTMNQSKLEMVKQEMARVNTDILGISEIKWTGMGEFNSDDHYIYYCGQESQGRNEVDLIINKTGWNVLLGYNLKNDRIISAHFPGKPFNIIVTQVYAPTTDAEEAEVDQFYVDPEDFPD